MSIAPVEETVFLGLGSNLGNRLAYLQHAVDRLQAQPGLTVIQASPVYTSAAHTLDPGEAQPDYLNAVVALRTSGAPLALLHTCQRIEREAGRQAAPERWTPRPLDLDLLIYGMRTAFTPALTLPHPRMLERRFVLAPLADLAPTLALPLAEPCTVQQALAACPDAHPVRRTAQPLRIHPAAKTVDPHA